MYRTIRALQDDYERETGSRPSRAAAAVLLDRHAEAEYQRRHGGAYDLAPTARPAPSADTTCRSCGFLPTTQRSAPTRRIAGVWYCLQHGMDIYCD